MGIPSPIVFLFDVDNTLLDNDRVIVDLRHFLTSEFGGDVEARYFAIFEELREELGYADYLGALQRYRVEQPTDSRLVRMSSFLIDYPFADRLYPDALKAVAHVKQWGRAVVLSDGDVVFQPRKVERSGIGRAVDGNVLIYIHKEAMLADVTAHYPAEHYVLIDDKLRILTAVKKIWGSRVTTVFPKQGHYAVDPEVLAKNPPADVSIERIGRLLDFDLSTLKSAATKPSTSQPGY